MARNAYLSKRIVPLVSGPATVVGGEFPKALLGNLPPPPVELPLFWDLFSDPGISAEVRSRSGNPPRSGAWEYIVPPGFDYFNPGGFRQEDGTAIWDYTYGMNVSAPLGETGAVAVDFHWAGANNIFNGNIDIGFGTGAELFGGARGRNGVTVTIAYSYIQAAAYDAAGNEQYIAGPSIGVQANKVFRIISAPDFSEFWYDGERLGRTFHPDLYTAEDAAQRRIWIRSELGGAGHKFTEVIADPYIEDV